MMYFNLHHFKKDAKHIILMHLNDVLRFLKLI